MASRFSPPFRPEPKMVPQSFSVHRPGFQNIIIAQSASVGFAIRSGTAAMVCAGCSISKNIISTYALA